jgi:ribosomal protein S21
MSPAKALLHKDIKQKLHTTMTPAKLQASKKQANTPFKPEMFRARIFQEVRLQKYFNYLKLKRARERESSKK